VRTGLREPTLFYYDEIADSERRLSPHFVAAMRSVAGKPQ
jgi:hypothetical protein